MTSLPGLPRVAESLCRAAGPHSWREHPQQWGPAWDGRAAGPEAGEPCGAGGCRLAVAPAGYLYVPKHCRQVVRLCSQVQVIQNILLHRVQVRVFNVDEPTAAGRQAGEGGSGHRAVPAGTGTGQDGCGVAWGPHRGHARRWRQGRDGDEPALRGARDVCLSVRALLSHELSSSLRPSLLVTSSTPLLLCLLGKKCF